MPLAARTVEPIFLGRRPLREEETGEDEVCVAVTQNAVIGALVQLASLVRHADDLFCDLADECQKVFEQTERIIHRVKRIKDSVGQLNAKTVSIPVGDLKRFSAVQDHHGAKHGYDCSLFTPDARPHCIKFRYSVCEVTPVGALRGADPYRKDGLRSSDLFKLWPVVLKDHQVNSAELSPPRSRRRAKSFDKKYKRLTPRRKTIDGASIFQQSENEDSVSTSSADNNLSKSQPSIVIAVDTSGKGFNKMSSFRQSLKGTASLDRKSRRRTVSGVSESIMQEIEVFERGRRTVRNMPRNYSFDDLDPRKEPDREELMAQYMDELDAKMEERAEEEHASRDRKLLKFLPCRRSRSLPRSVKLKDSKSRGVMVFEQDENAKDKDKLIVTARSSYASSSLSLGSAGASSSSSCATRRSSIISNKIKSFVTGTLRPRPKSLDLDSVDVLGNEADVEEDDGSSSVHSRANLKRTISPSMPDNISSLTSSRESKVGPGTYYYFTSSTMPRAQARKYDFPWESLPKDWTTAVKLREISKRRKEERNSSSGNWSGSSYRQSLDSERSSTVPSASQHSLSRDSGRDSMGDDKDERQQSDKGKRASGVSSFLPLTTTDGGSSDTEQWLASLAKRAAAREDAAAAGSEVTESLTRLSELTKKNILALEETFAPSKLEPLRLEDDEVMSEYSLDQDGFYTSFHTDSGLRRSTGTLLDGDDNGDTTPVKDTQSLLSMDSSNTIDSVIFCPMGNARPGMAGDSRARPAPPVRRGSRLSDSSSLADKGVKGVNTALREDSNSKFDEDFVFDSGEFQDESSAQDSDQETIHERLKVKTKISSRVIPSWCSVSDESSPENSNTYLSGPHSKDTASISFSGSTSNEAGIAESLTFIDSQNKSGDGCEEFSEDSWGLPSLPRLYLESKVWEEDLSDHSNSWPRSRRSQQQPKVGILKREKSPAGSLKPKTLNFAPVVNMFDDKSSKRIELPLNASSSHSSCSSDTSTAGLAFTLSNPPSVRPSGLSKSLFDIKHTPSVEFISSDATDFQHKIKATSTPVSRFNRASRTEHGREKSESSVSSSESSLRSDCGRDDYLADACQSSHDTLSSSSSVGLSDIDSSLTYVSWATSPNSTQMRTTTLDPDDMPTPVNSPVHEHAMAFPDRDSRSAGMDEKLPESNGVTVLQDLPTTSQHTAPKLSVCSGVADRQSLGSFAADANTDAAPTSWTGSQPGVMTTSADSGFSSPTSHPPSATEQPSHRHRHHHHHHHNQHRHHHQTNSQPAKRSPQLTSQAREDRYLSGGDGVYSGDTNTVDRQSKSENISSRRTARQKREPLKATYVPSSPQLQQSAPRSDSYRAATLEEVSQQPRRSTDGGARPRIRPNSSVPIMNSRPPSPHQQFPKSVSCPSGVMADPDAVSRADSYRLAVRNTQGVVGDIGTRNTSYRMATRDGDNSVPDDRMDAINSWGTRRLSGSRDVRRLGITDIDQLKCYESDSSNGKTSSSSMSEKLSSKGFAGIHSHKKMKPEVQNLLRGDKTPSPEVKRIPNVSSRNTKDKDKNKKRSSTYIRFDPIFEQNDSMYTSTETLRAQSVEMINSEEDLLMSDKVVGHLPPGRVRSKSSGRRTGDERASTSILGSIKTTIKSISGKNTADKDPLKDSRYV